MHGLKSQLGALGLTPFDRKAGATLFIYREDLAILETSKERFNQVEKLIHQTKDNPSPKYTQFDENFHKFPSYFRRSATAEALGIISSHKSNLFNYNEKKLQVESDGTVIDRVFINQSVEKDQLLHRLGRLKKAQKQSGQNSKNKFPNHWRKINNLQKQIVNDTASQIIKFAEKNDADVVVFEYLGKFKKIK
ncbi:MAG: hypothetical protein JJE29_06140, partial [Peptostreptococcaceae bacterium]|nr:hypothetical protein [Peptostreptococcaceae bacterium]